MTDPKGCIAHDCADCVKHRELLLVHLAKLEEKDAEIERLRGHIKHIGNDALRAENHQLRTKLAEIAAQEPVAYVLLDSWITGQYWPNDCFFECEKPPNEAKPLYATPVAQPAKPVEYSCEWTQSTDFEMGDTYSSSCGELWSFIDGGPMENRVTYCHNCGKPVKLAAKGKS